MVQLQTLAAESEKAVFKIKEEINDEEANFYI